MFCQSAMFIHQKRGTLGSAREAVLLQPFFLPQSVLPKEVGRWGCLSRPQAFSPPAPWKRKGGHAHKQEGVWSERVALPAMFTCAEARARE